jgi:hypothetical protein
MGEAKEKPKQKPGLRKPGPKTDNSLPEITLRPALTLPHDSLVPEKLPITLAFTDLSSLAREPIRELSRDLTREPVREPIGTPVSKPARERDTATRGPVARLHSNENYKWLDATHAASEQRVYSVMYRTTQSKGMSDGYFSVKALQKATGIGGHDTVRKALKGLVLKRSVEVVNRDRERTIGPLYRVYTPKQIEERRLAAGIAVDAITKEIRTLTEQSNSESVGSLTRELARELAREPKTSTQALLKQESMNNISNNADSSPAGSSSSVGKRDDGKLRQVQVLFNQLSGGGSWRADRDEPTYEQIAHVDLYHIILGLCYSVGKSPEHKMSSLAYAVPSILKHSEEMAEFPAEQLIEIAYRTKRKTLNCIQTGKWTVPEWES